MLRQYFYQSQSEVIFTMVTKEYELHAAFSPLVTKRLAFDAFSRLRRYVGCVLISDDHQSPVPG